MKKRNLSVVLMAFLLVFCLSLSVPIYASGGLAVSAGKNFEDGVDTREDATNASSAYKKAGYTVVTLKNPTKSDFTNTRLKADILFLSGHGNEDVLSFGTYKFVCQSGTANSNYTNLWNTAKNQKLITFAGCNTAGGNKNGGSTSTNNNIVKRAVDRGADVAVGWTTTVSAGSHTNWLKRYNNALADGKSVSQAINAANSYIYLPGSGVKNVKYYGNGNVKITSARRSSALNLYDSSILEVDRNQVIFKEIIDLAFMSNGFFDTEDYQGYVYPTDEGYLVDVYYKSNGIATNVALTIHIDFNGKIIEAKTHNIDTNSLESLPAILENEPVMLATDRFKERVATVEQNSIQSFESVSNQVQFEYYDIEEKITYLVTYTEIIDDVGAKYVTENISPIE